MRVLVAVGIGIGIGIATGLTGCGEAPTQLVAVVGTDMPPDALDGFTTRVLDERGHTVDERSFTRGRAAAAGVIVLPASFGVAPVGGDAERRVTVEVDARHGADRLFTTRSVTGFVEHQVLALDMFLASRCVQERCPPGFTCRRDGCAAEWVDPGTLGPYRGPEPDGQPDAAVQDGGGRDAASADAAPDDAAIDAAPDGGPTPATFWSWAAEGPSLVDFVDGAVAPDGTFFVAGDFRVEVTLAAETLTALGGRDGFLAAFQRDGRLSWLVDVGGAGATVSTTSVAADSDGGVWVSGLFMGPLQEPAELDGAAGAGFLLHWSAEGTPDASHLFASSVEASVNAVAVAPDGRLAVAGSYAGDLDSPLGAYLSADTVGFVGLFGGDAGVPCALQALGTPAPVVASVAFAPDGTLVVGGALQGDFALGALGAAARGTSDAFVAAVDAQCVVRSLSTIAGQLSLVRVAHPADDTLLVARSSDDLLDPGPARPGRLDVLRATLSDAWVMSPLALDGGIALDILIDVFADAHGMLLGGQFEGDATFAGELLSSTGAADGFVTELDAQGTVLGTRQLGGDGRDAILVLARDATGSLLVAGSYQDRIDLGEAGVLTSDLSPGLYVARLPSP